MVSAVKYNAVVPVVPVVPPAAHRTWQITASLPKRPAARCSSCAMRAICMPHDLTLLELARLDSIICSTRAVKRGDALYRANDPFQSIYAVRAGSFKTVIMHRDGHEQVTGFQLAGEALGLDGCDAIALEDSNVCIIQFHLLETLCREVKVMQHHLQRIDEASRACRQSPMDGRTPEQNIRVRVRVDAEDLESRVWGSRRKPPLVWPCLPGASTDQQHAVPASRPSRRSASAAVRASRHAQRAVADNARAQDRRSFHFRIPRPDDSARRK